MTSDPLLSSLTHVVVDEVHERTTQGDFLLALLRRVLAARNTHNARAKAGGSSGGPGVLPPLKVVLMSATLDAGLYSKYFGGCPGEAGQGKAGCVECCVVDAGNAFCPVHRQGSCAQGST
jgi:HrpA-like RNA helicase